MSLRTAVALLAASLSLSSCRARERPPDVNELVTQLRGADVEKSGEARVRLIALGEPAAPALAALLRSGTPGERVTAANTLWGMGARGRAAVPDLIGALDDGDATLRAAVAMALQNMGAAAGPAVPALVHALNDRESAVRQAAVKALGAIGPAASPALSALTLALRRGSWPEAEDAVRRIRGTGAGTPLELEPAEGEAP